MEIRDFKPEDWHYIKESVRTGFGEIDQLFFKKIQNGVNVSIVDGNHVCACGGIVNVTDDVGIAWIKVNKYIKERIKFAKTLLLGFDELFKKSNRHVISHVLFGFSKGLKLAQHLGFEFTGKQVTIGNAVYDEFIKKL